MTRNKVTKFLPYLLAFFVLAVSIYYCNIPGPHGKPADTRARDSLMTLVDSIQDQFTKDTSGNYLALKAKDSVIQTWRDKYRRQKAKTVVVKIREEVPAIDSALIACDSLDSVNQNQISALKFQLDAAYKTHLMTTDLYKQADTASQGVITRLQYQNDSLAVKNRRLTKTNKRLWLGNLIQALGHAARSLD